MSKCCSACLSKINHLTIITSSKMGSFNGLCSEDLCSDMSPISTSRKQVVDCLHFVKPKPGWCFKSSTKMGHSSPFPGVLGRIIWIYNSRWDFSRRPWIGIKKIKIKNATASAVFLEMFQVCIPQPTSNHPNDESNKWIGNHDINPKSEWYIMMPLLHSLLNFGPLLALLSY